MEQNKSKTAATLAARFSQQDMEDLAQYGASR